MTGTGRESFWIDNKVWILPVIVGIPLGLALSGLLAVFLFLTLHQGWNTATAAIIVGAAIPICGACCGGIYKIPQMKDKEKKRRQKEA